MLRTSCRYTLTTVAVFLLSSCATATEKPNEKPVIELYGEIHGTDEIPAYFEIEIRKQINKYGRLSVGIELTQPELDSACVVIEGKREFPSTTLGWFGTVQDGRYSQSMANMVCNVTKIEDVTLFPMISDNGSVLRDKMISEAIISRSNLNSRIVALMGNFHARASDSSAAGLVRAAGLDVTTYVFDARTNSRAWFCQSGANCGIADIGARFCSSDEELAVIGVIVKDTPGTRWNKCVSLENFTPSPPIGICVEELIIR